MWVSPFFDPFAAFDCVGIPIEWRSSSLGRYRAMRSGTVPGQKLSIADCARCCLDHHPEHIVQLGETSPDVGPTSQQCVCVTLELRRRSSDAVLSKFS